MLRDMKNRLLDFLMPILPKNDLSHWVGRLVHQPLPGALGRKSVELFKDFYHIDMNEAELPLEQYRTIGELFTRKLKEGARPIGKAPVHPADSVIAECGLIEDGQILQAKGKVFSVAELLTDPRVSAEFVGGCFVTYYLCPTDYHRVHSPVSGEIDWLCHVPGEMWPVNGWSVNKIDRLYARNERICTRIQTSVGPVAVVMVAATNVGNMSLAFDSSVRSQIRLDERSITVKNYLPKKKITTGDEFGVFHMGSTVVVLFSNPDAINTANTRRGDRVQVGQSL